MKEDKFFSMNDDDVEITYRRRKTPTTEDINGFNPIILVGVFMFALIGLVVISQNNNNPAPSQSTPVIINNN